MLKSRTLILFCLIVLVALATNLFIDNNGDFELPRIIAKNDPDLYMKNANITQYTATGIRQHKIKAARLTHFPLTNITTLVTPFLTLYSTQQERDPWDISADHGRLLPKVQLREEIVELWEQVHAIQQDKNGNFIDIKTDSLTVYPKQDYAETDQKVYIDDNTGRTTAGGMKAYFEAGKFVFFSSDTERVKSILLPPS
ncbi:MAG: LPS export ABC transporter periplasmic protein LptC [Pseudomonadales bacterium]|nr:LPS export ABC transporter periplasmic protein LptC [Pseudomonadales bacterium]